MAHNGKRYSEEFKRQIIDLYLSGKSVAELAEEYGLVEQTIHKWNKLYTPSIEVDALKAVKNACIESFHSLIKKEEIYSRVYKDSIMHWLLFL